MLSSAETLLMLMPLAAAIAIVLARQQLRIGALKRDARRLRRGLTDLESLFEQAPLGMAVFDTELRFVRINALLAHINGLAAEDHAGKTLREIVPGVADVSEAAFQKAMETGKPVVGLVFDGATEVTPELKRTWRLSVHPVFGRTGDVVGVSAAVEDITEQQRLAAALRDSEQRERRRAIELESVMETAPIAILIAHDRECHHVTANTVARRLLRLAPGESPSLTGPGMRPYDVHADGAALAPDALPLQRAAATGEETWRRALVTHFAGGDSMPITMNAMPLRDEGGRVRGAVAAFVDLGGEGDAAVAPPPA